jgi:hypothetical protein
MALLSSSRPPKTSSRFPGGCWTNLKHRFVLPALIELLRDATLAALESHHVLLAGTYIDMMNSILESGW